MKKTMLFVAVFAIAITAKSQQFVPFSSTFHVRHADIVAMDVNNDGKLDIIVSGESQTGDPIQSAIFINNGDNTYTLQGGINVINPGHSADIKMGDINGDGFMDVIFNGNDNGAAGRGIAINDGTGIFNIPATPYNVTNATISCGFADFNNDGLLDYYVIGNGTGNIGTIFFQNQDGTFTKDDTSFTGTNLIDPDVTVLDFNNDGYLDMFICAWDDNAKSRISEILINDGFGHFTTMAQPNLIQKGYGSAVWADVDGDGWLDLLLNGDGGANGEASSDKYRLYKNNGGVLEPKATFNDYRQISVGDGARMVDWNNDGKLDIILTGWSNTKNRQVTMLFTCTDAANFTFVEDTNFSSSVPGVSESSIETADLNNDGKIDLLITGGNYGQTAGLSTFITGYVLNTTSAVNVKPTAPTGLATANTGTDPIVLTWNAATDDLTPVKSLTYNVYLKNTTTGKWLYNPMAVMGDANDGWRKVSGEMGNVGTNKRWELYNLPNGSYEWSVQAIDANFTGGSFATKQTFVVSGRTTAINDIRLNTNVHVFGSEGKLHIENNNNENLSVSVYSVTGKLMKQFNTSVVNSVSLNHGAYLVTLSNGTNVKTQKVIL
jgi:hypothetical protein